MPILPRGVIGEEGVDIYTIYLRTLVGVCLEYLPDMVPQAEEEPLVFHGLLYHNPYVASHFLCLCFWHPLAELEKFDPPSLESPRDAKGDVFSAKGTVNVPSRWSCGVTSVSYNDPSCVVVTGLICS